MRSLFGKFIASRAARNLATHLVVGDIGYRVFDDIRLGSPDQFHNVGICEQSMIGFAAGMALANLEPWVYTITPFLIERPFEQVKLDIDQQNVNVKLVGFADYPNLGPTHRTLNERLMMGMFENIRCFYPSSGQEAMASFAEASNIEGPCFISLKTAIDS